MSYNLQVLSDNREALLLAEVAAWLHDMGKCADEHITRQANNCPSGYSYQYKTAYSSLIASALSLNLLGETIPIRTLVEQARPRAVRDTTQTWLLRVLGRCHAAAHIEKEEADRTGKQPAANTRISTAYGYESAPVSGLTAALRGLPYANITDRSIFQPAVQEAFSQALGETRRPENEITLWDWSSLVAALYKASLAGALLGSQPPAQDLRWRLLSVRVEGLSYSANASRSPDILARRDLLTEAFNRVRTLLEETYLLGAEVYRDEDGSVFVVPDLADLLEREDNGVTLQTLILKEFKNATLKNDAKLKIDGEIVPEIKVDDEPWWGQDPQRKGNDELPPVAEHLSPASATPDPTWVSEQWGRADDICPVCGLRPQAAPGTKAGRRKVCAVCEQRRADRSKEWATSPSNTTIWTDEVADANGRLALIVGQFDLTHWLDGTMVKTLLVTDPQSSNAVPKNPSFARIRRVWETTRRFWEEIRDGCHTTVGQAGPRLEIIPQGREQLDLGQFHTYELVLGQNRLSVVWDSDNHCFITCDNLAYTAKLLGKQPPKREKDEQTPDYSQRLQQWGAREVRSYLSGTLVVEEPVGYGGKNKVWGEIIVTDAQPLPDKYTPAIPILAEPRTFMALVPANRALEVITAIKTKYECEMGKVRNRLPLTLGAVYFGRRTPLAAALDAGRRMLRRPSQTAQAEVSAISPVNPWPKKVALTLELGKREIVVSVPTVMGDETTSDVWYPYWRVKGSPTGRERQFMGPDGAQWVHVTKLRVGDKVAFTPSTFDFEYLDTTARRFEVSYQDGHRRGADKRQRPYLLEELDNIEKVWAEVSQVSKSQIRMIESLI
ncbi:MAG: CRISPR-associated protein Csx11, partial [Chloroflexota bacterium]|nr:CRISPR-associated protein Csx11 [Chloroflexota bacterium]